MLNFDSWKTVFVFLDFGNYVVMTGEYSVYHENGYD